MLAGSADAMYIIGEPAGGWSPQKGIEMEEADGGWKWTGTMGADQWFGFATDLLTSDDWNNFNGNYRLNPPANGTVAGAGEYALTLGGQDCAFRGNGAKVTYFIKQNGNQFTLTVTELSDVPDVPEEEWGIVGAFNNWGETPDVKMTETRTGVWTATMTNLSGEFKFRANNTWGSNYGAAGSSLIEADGIYAVSQGGGNFNLAEEAESITFELDLNNNTLTVDGLTPPMLALRGNFVDWGFEWSYLFQEAENGNYSLYLDGVGADWEFKIADQNWAEEYTTNNMEMVAGVKYELKPGNGLGNMGVDKDYTDVDMYFNLKEGLFWFNSRATSGVAAVEIANGTARYFNLQGAEVNNPANGIFIRVLNGKAEKILVK